SAIPTWLASSPRGACCLAKSGKRRPSCVWPNSQGSVSCEAIQESGRKAREALGEDPTPGQPEDWAQCSSVVVSAARRPATLLSLVAEVAALPHEDAVELGVLREGFAAVQPETVVQHDEMIDGKGQGDDGGRGLHGGREIVQVAGLLDG